MPATKDFFLRFPNPMLIETGTFKGDGIEAALSAGFSFVVSIELDDELYRQAATRFAANPRVRIFHGSSDHFLWHIISDLNCPVTFWLDAHYSGKGTAKGDKFSPVFEELRQIGQHPIKSHTILIDDRRLLGSEEFDFATEEDVRQAMLAINPQYLLSAETGDPSYPNDVLVARI